MQQLFPPESFGYRPVSAPQWNVPVVHEALVSDPYEPLERSSLKALSFKTALLLALTSAMRVSELFHSEEEDFYINNTSQMENNDYSNVTSHNNSTDNPYYGEPHIIYVMTCVIISIGLPLTLVAIYSLYSQVKNDHVAPIYIINLLISDIIQLCCMIVGVAKPDWKIYQIFSFIYDIGVLANIGFMVSIALERYLVIAWPLWYHFRRTIKSSLVVCVVVWTLPLVFLLSVYFWVKYKVAIIILGVLSLVPLPLLIFFLGGTLKSLSAAISVSSDEKRQIVGMLVLVLLIYTLLFLPTIIVFLIEEVRDNDTLIKLRLILLRFSPLADLILYVFMRRGAIDKLLASLCCCRMDSDDNSRSSV
ncbi:ovarian cancer G-protein coupled receptor 1-like [Thunnus albacares]|uniref:ovarian cancer G-protein coupled receptor 1-like n=1 Tax=Thunnus albacares TaxID=8236 RepID=UPI001CF66D0B|nr:ovarian cancer G-protein coupled receptor 1-like [Thunnus albacares]